MAVIVLCDDPQGLLGQIKKGIADGTIETWLTDTDGDFIHSPKQWQNLAWFRPSVQQDRLVFNILGNRDIRMSKVTYGVYHGRFIEMLLTHFDLKFNRAFATALAVPGDWVGPATQRTSSSS
jgi:hypothetical protein